MIDPAAFVLDAGPLGLLALATALVGVALGVLQVAQGHRRSYEGAIAICAGLALMIGVLGTGLGLRIAADAVSRADVEVADSLWRMGTSIAWSCTSVGALGAILDLGALLVVGLLRPVRD